MTSDDLVLKVHNIETYYGNIMAIKGISIDVQRGHVVSILGANGAGKTTILKTISGLKHPTTGEIYLHGQRIDSSNPSKIVGMGIGHVPEGAHVFRDMSVQDNLSLGAFVRKDREGIKEDLETVYGHFPRLKERLRQRAGSLSGGEQQMLAIGRALICRPKLLLMDEPSIGLSPLLVQEIAAIIVEIVNKQSISVLLVEQNASLALQLAYRGYVIETGQIALSGTRGELVNNDKVKKAYLGG